MPDGIQIPGGPLFRGRPRPPDVPCDPTGESWRGPQGVPGPPGPQGPPGSVEGAPVDGTTYGVRDGNAWIGVLPLAGGRLSGALQIGAVGSNTLSISGGTLSTDPIRLTRSGTGGIRIGASGNNDFGFAPGATLTDNAQLIMPTGAGDVDVGPITNKWNYPRIRLGRSQVMDFTGSGSQAGKAVLSVAANHSATTTGTAVDNINVAFDLAAIDINTYCTGLVSATNMTAVMGGDNARSNGWQTLYLNLNETADTHPDDPKVYVTQQIATRANVNHGGTAEVGIGSYWGINSVLVANPNATNLAAMFGVELDFGIGKESNLRQKIGFAAYSASSDELRGQRIDAAYTIGASRTATFTGPRGWQHGFLFGHYNTSFFGDTDSTCIKIGYAFG